MIDELGELIDSYTQRKGCSLHSLSRSTGISYSTIKRIATRETTPEFTNVLKILKGLDRTPVEVTEFLKDHYSDVSQYMTQIYKDYRVADTKIDSYMTDRLGFQLINAGFAESGISRDYVVRRFGEEGLKLLEELLEHQILREVNGRIKAADIKSIDPDVALEKVRLASNLFKTQHLGDGKSMISFQVEGWSNWGLERIYALNKKFVGDIHDLSQNPKARGNAVAFVASLFNRLVEEKSL